MIEKVPSLIDRTFVYYIHLSDRGYPLLPYILVRFSVSLLIFKTRLQLFWLKIRNTCYLSLACLWLLIFLAVTYIPWTQHKTSLLFNGL